MKEAEVILKYQEAFKRLGFVIEEFGGKEYCIRAVPANLFGLGEQELFIELLDSVIEDGIMADMDMITDKIASMACKAAVKANQNLSRLEIEHLLEELMKCENPYTCPHGRPTMISMTKTEIEKKFKRIV
jgi:DNA mismatch repair protein MutL